jgi:hypothetical protein
MKRRNRTVSIFTLSALDVLAMSTGVFVLLLVMLMPYYRKDFEANAQVAAVRAATAETIARVDTLQRQATLYSGEAEAAEAEAARLMEEAAVLEQKAAASRRPVPEPAPKPRELPAGDPKYQVAGAIDLIFVIDTTSSMRPAIRELAYSLRGIVRILERLVPSVRIGVAAYSDRDTGLAPVTVMPLTPTDRNMHRIAAFMENISASPVGSRTLEEDLHLGMQAAMMMPLRADARQAIVVIGDAAAHREYQGELVTRASNFARGQKLRSISALWISTPTSREHGQRGRDFFKELANAGGGTFNDHTGSMIESVLLSVLVD